VALRTSTSDRAKGAGDRGDQPGNLILIGDIGEKALGDAAIHTDAAADGSDLLVAGAAIDRHGKVVKGLTPRDRRPQAPRAARHQSDTPMRHCDAAIIPPAAQHAGRAPALGGPIGHNP
jgi:hypothetical protein